jgi:hypothetical protein
LLSTIQTCPKFDLPFLDLLFILCTLDLQLVFSSSICMQKMMVSQSPTPKHAIRSVLDLLSTTEQTRSSGSNKTSLLTLCSISRDRRSFTDMLMITTTVRMVDRVHSNTTSLGPRVALDCKLVLCARRFCRSCQLLCSTVPSPG